MKKSGLIFLMLALALTAVLAQRRGRGGNRGGGYGGESWISEDTQTAGEVPSHSTGTPTWTNAAGFEKDVWTFVRIKRGRTYGSGGSWTTDAPDSDLNLSFRLQQMTSMKTSPDGRFLWLTEKALADYPFIYMVEPGSLSLTDPEIAVLRNYLLNGGFLWLDDFWGEDEWNGMEDVLRHVFPDRKFEELKLDHPIYNCVFQIKAKSQVPNYRLGEESQYNGGMTWERWDAREVHHRAIYDDKHRMMVLATHNTDNGDGWEREGEFPYYFEHFSEKIAYPLGINVVFYVMTH